MLRASIRNGIKTVYLHAMKLRKECNLLEMSVG